MPSWQQKQNFSFLQCMIRAHNVLKASQSLLSSLSCADADVSQVHAGMAVTIWHFSGSWHSLNDRQDVELFQQLWVRVQALRHETACH